MQERIYTIPISEVFEPKCGCPICAMHDMLETRCVDYIMGAAMMEPDVRIETNRLGFCKQHFDMMHAKQNRLSLALILETRLAQIHENVFDHKKNYGKKVSLETDTCYVCQKIDGVMDGMIDNVLKLFASDAEFRQLFSEQPVICLPHYEMLAKRAAERYNRKNLALFMNVLTPLCERYLTELTNDVHHFTTRFDYRFGGKDAEWGNSKDSIERAIWFLTGRKEG